MLAFTKFNKNPPGVCLYSLNLGAIPGLSSFAIMFLPIDPTNMPASVALDETWNQYYGLYLFLDNGIATEEDASALIKALADLKISGAMGFIWVQNNGSSEFTLLNFLPVSRDLSTQSYTVNELSIIQFRNFTLGINKGTTITLNTDNFNFIFNSVSLYASTLFFAVTRGEKFGRIGPSINSAAAQDLANHFALLSFMPDISIGCWKFQLTLEKNPLPNLPGDIDKLDIACRYFVDSPSRSDKLVSYHYPLLSTINNPISFMANLDVHNLLNTMRSFFTLADPDLKPGNKPPSIDTYYRDRLGQTITITQADQNSKFVFAVNQQNKAADLTDPLYLVPQGSFNIGINNKQSSDNNKFRFLCSFSDLEYLGAEVLAGCQLCFVSGQNAYCDLSKVNQIVPASQLLDNIATTSWVYLALAGKGVQYYVQSTYLAFYTLGFGNGFMDYCEIPLGTLKQDSSSSGVAFPLVSYAGIAPNDMRNLPLDYKTFEYRVLSQVRRDIIENNLSTVQQASSETAITAVTTQGIGATFSGQNLSTWESLILAVDSKSNQLQLQNIAEPLRKALLSNQVFMVINNKAEFIKLCNPINMELNVAGWTFLLSPDNWQDGGIMLLKFHSLSVEELINDLSLWDLPNVATSNINKTLHTIIDAAKSDVDAKAKNGQISLYEGFVSIITDPLWNGVIFLNSPISISFQNFPPEFDVLMPGIDPNKLKGHHVGVNLTPVTSQKNRGINFETSSMFGLVIYEDPNLTLMPNVDYQYAIASLSVLLKNSQIEYVSGKMLLQINKLFGYPVAPANQPIYLECGAQSHQGNINCSFICANEAKFIFPDKQSVINNLTINQVVFSTFGNYQDSQNNQIKIARFDMHGNIEFNQVGNFDIFSFASAAYNHLYLNLQFNSATPKNYSLDFDAAHLSINSRESVLRPASLASQFPMIATRIISGATTVPTMLGYMPIAVIPSNWSSVLNNQWYGLGFNLNLGSLGALGDNKNFSAEILVLWSPPDTTPSQATTSLQDAVWMGIKLPGFSKGNNLIDFEGVLKLGLDAIWLQQESDAYVLVFKNFALHLLNYALPKGAAVDLQLFGDPGNQTSSLAWYGSYVKLN